MELWDSRTSIFEPVLRGRQVPRASTRYYYFNGMKIAWAAAPPPDDAPPGLSWLLTNHQAAHRHAGPVSGVTADGFAFTLGQTRSTAGR
jgi:hypothetical protein